MNAVMNCSYIQASHIQVAIYDDRLEITSPGGLLPGVTIDLMKEGFSKIRNRSLANAFSYMNLVEAWGSGIPKLNEVNAPDSDPNDLNDPDNDHKNDLESRVSELLRQNPELTHKALAEALSVSAVTIKRTLSKMQHEGKVIREGSNRKGKWILKN